MEINIPGVTAPAQEAEQPARTEPERRPCPKCGKSVTWTQAGVPRHHKCEPKAGFVPETQEVPNAVAPETAVITADEVVSAYVNTRDAISAEKKIFEAKVAELKKLQTNREAWLMGKLDELGCTSFKTPVGTPYISHAASVTVADRDVFFNWVFEDWPNRNGFLNSAANKTEVNTLVEDGKAPPPGVNYTRIKKVNVRK